MIQQDFSIGGGAGVTLFGVGGAGGNAVSRLFRRPDTGMKIICANTDIQALRAAPRISQLQLGRRLTAGLGAGARPEIGRAAAQEALADIHAALDQTSLCFIAAGLGGGTGTGAAPVIARAARERGILTIGIATRPFAFEGARRARTATAGLVEFQDSVDAMVVVCNENLFRVSGRDTTFRQALDLSDSIVCDSTTDFAALIAGQALKRVTIADIRSILNGGGRTVVGYGERCAGLGRAALAAESALSNPLLEDVAHGAKRLLVTIAGGPDLGLFELEEAVEYLRGHVHKGADLVWGSVIDPALEGRIRVGIAATGLPAGDSVPEPVAARPRLTPARPISATLSPECEAPSARPAEAGPMPGPSFQPEQASILTKIRAGGSAATIPTPPAEPDQDILVLTNAYSLNLDIIADNPVSTLPVRSRAGANLMDRVYFATRDLRRRWRSAELPAPHQPYKAAVGGRRRSAGALQLQA